MPFLIIGAGTTLYVLWALTAFPFQVYIKNNSIVYTGCGYQQHACLGVLYVVSQRADRFSFLKSKTWSFSELPIVVILLIVMAVKEYAFTSVWQYA